LIGVGLLVLLNGFFVAAEYALVTARRTRIIELHHQGNKRARAVLKIPSGPSQFITAMQLGVTLTSLGIGALGEHALSKAFDTVMATLRAAQGVPVFTRHSGKVYGTDTPGNREDSWTEKGTDLYAEKVLRNTWPLTHTSTLTVTYSEEVSGTLGTALDIVKALGEFVLPAATLGSSVACCLLIGSELNDELANLQQGLVAAMGGRIWVTSNEGRGSSFGFELPLAQAGASGEGARRV